MIITTMKRAKHQPKPAWLVMVVTIPGEQPALRMRLWRKLKASGAGVLRDGVYVGPKNDGFETLFRAQAEELVAAGGTAQMLSVDGQATEFSHLFDRTAEYKALIQGVGTAAKALKTLSAVKLKSQVEALRRDFEALVSREFFSNALQQKTREALDDLSGRVLRKLSPDEPHAAHKRLQKLDRGAYRERIWATRGKPWVDRLASAWLIKRFIDPKARIKWLKDPAQKPAKALGFDFDGAEFTHVDEKVTFEVLMHSFDLEADDTLDHLAAIVHYLDVGGIPVPEAAGIEAILRGMRQRTPNDDALLAAASLLFDDLFAGFKTAPT
jgi:hypothetical protein